MDQSRTVRSGRLSYRTALVLLSRVPLGAKSGSVTLEFREADKAYDPAAVYGGKKKPTS